MATSNIISTTKGRMFLVALDSLERVDIQYVPKELVFTRQPKIGEIAIVGRNVPKLHQTGGNKTVKLQLDFFSVDASRTDVIRKVAMIESWTYNEGVGRNATRVVLIFGDLFRNEVWTITGVSTKMSNFSKGRFLPQQAYVDLTLKLDPTFDVRRSDVR